MGGGGMHLCTAYCHKKRIVKLLSHWVISFCFKKGKTGYFTHQFRAIISSFLINLLNTTQNYGGCIHAETLSVIIKSNQIKSNLLLLRPVIGGRVPWAVRYLDKLQWRAVGFGLKVFLKIWRKRIRGM